MSQPEERVSNEPSLQSDGNQPGEICLSDLVNTKGQISEETPIKEEPSSHGIYLNSSGTEKVEFRSNDIDSDEYLKSGKSQKELNQDPAFRTKNIWEKSQSLEGNASSDFQPIQSQEVSANLLQEFKNEVYQIRDRYFEQESQIYQKYVLNMQETLQKEYEDCRRQSIDMINQDQIECQEIETCGQKQNKLFKNEIQGELKNINCQNVTEDFSKTKFQSNILKKNESLKQLIILENESDIQNFELGRQFNETSPQQNVKKNSDLQIQIEEKIIPQSQVFDLVLQIPQSGQSPNIIMSQTIEIHEEVEHIDENDTPMFGNCNENQTSEISQETPSLMPINLELNEDPQIHLPLPSQNLKNDKVDTQEPVHQQNPTPKSPESVAPQKTINIDESQEEEAIFVPKKQQSPQLAPVETEQGKNNESTQKLSAEEVRKLLLAAETDWTDIIKNASDSQILQFYEELNKSEVTNIIAETNQQQPETNQIQEESIYYLPSVQFIYQNSETQVIQHEPIIEEPSNSTVPQIQQQPFQTTLIPQQGQAEEQFEIIVATLIEHSPELRQEIMKFSKEDLVVMYKDILEETKSREEPRPSKNKKKKSQPIIDLEDENNEPANNNSLSDSAVHANSNSSINDIPQSQPKATFSYLAQYQKRIEEESLKKPTPKPSGPIYVNKTLLYQLIRSHDFEGKLKSIMMPKESVKYQEKTQKEIALLYLNHLKKNNIANGPFESQTKKPGKGFVILTSKNSTIKNEQFKDVCKEGLGIEIPKITDEKKQKILELRQKRIQGSGSAQTISNINTLPSGISAIAGPVTPVPSLLRPIESQSPAKVPGRRRYCLIVQEELDAREEEEIGLQHKPKRVKKSTGEFEDKEILDLMKSFEKIIGTGTPIELEH